MRLIDADALLDGLEKWKNDDPYRTLRWPWERWVRNVGIQVLEIVVKQMNPVDAVEVVRCEDCKYGLKSHLQPYCEEKEYLCRHNYGGCYHRADHWCAYGKRLGSEEEKQMKEESTNGGERRPE